MPLLIVALAQKLLMRGGLLCFYLFFFLHIHAQRAETALQKFAESHPQEKVVLLLSKTEYLAGETIYFKAYVVSGYSPSSLSTNLYTEFYNKEKKLLQKGLVPLVQGSGHGSFVLPSSTAEDVYYIRAYTQWMRNFDEGLFYLQPVPVYNPYSSQSLHSAPVQWTAEAFVEGGQMLAGEVANVAVRLSSAGQLPGQWAGQVMEAGASEPVASLTVYNNQVGQVRFLPQEGKTYRLLVKDGTGKTAEQTLPLVQKSGILLQSGVTEGLLRYNLLFKNIPSGGKGYKLIAAFNNEVAATATITQSPGFVRGTFDFRQLPPGLLHLTLFNEKEEPVIERLYFLHQDSLSAGRLSLSTDTLSLEARAYNHWQISGDTLVPISAAVMVGDASLWQPPPFFGPLYLSADLSSPVRDADWYFTDVSPEKRSALDALLLTEKWSRFQWPALLQNRVPAIRYGPDAYLKFTGTVRKGNKPEALRDINLIMRGIDSSFSVVQVKTDKEGKFMLNDLFFTELLNVYYQPDKRKLLERDLEISFTAENEFAPPATRAWPYSPFITSARTKKDTLPPAIKKAQAQRATEQLLAEKIKRMEEVVITTRAKNVTQELERQLTSGLFSGGNADVFDFVNDNQNNIGGYTNILDWLRGRVPSLTVSSQNGVLVPQIRNGPVQLFVNEMLADPDMISSLSPFDIALVKIFRGNFVGSLGAGSAIAIYTRRGGMSAQNSGPSLPSALLKGYSRVELPFLPNYSLDQEKPQTDERTLLLYTPLLPGTGEDHKIDLQFYNNDAATPYRLLVTGFAPDGRPLYLNRLVK